MFCINDQRPERGQRDLNVR